MTRFPEIKEYQVVFENRDSMLEAKIKIECEQNITSALEGALQESFSCVSQWLLWHPVLCPDMR